MKLNQGAKVHFMGICGTAMASLAGLFKEKGFQVSGSDKDIYPPMSTQLESLGISVMLDYKAENLCEEPDLVIVGNVISKNFPETEALLKSSIPYTSSPKAIADYVIEGRHSVVVVGTHGKTTTTALLAWIAKVCQVGAGFLVGGIPKNFEQSFLLPEGDYFIIEGDEYDTSFFDKRPKFIHYKPRSVILTSLEFDHADIYNSLEEIKESFVSLMKLIPEQGVLIYNSDDKNVCEVAESAKCKKISYGLNSGNYQARQRRLAQGQNQFVVSHLKEAAKEAENLAEVSTSYIGAHNTLNTLASFVLATELGWPKEKVLQAIKDFEGVKRRQEIIGRPRDIVVIEDFAHHPTSVLLTIEAMKELYPEQKLFAVFEPRSSTSRRNTFQTEYVESLSGADEILVAEAYRSEQIREKERFSSQKLVEDLKKKNKKASFFFQTRDIIGYLAAVAKPKDVILIMSNGGFDGIYQKLLSALEQAEVKAVY